MCMPWAGSLSLAIAVLGFAVEKLSAEVAREIITGAKAVCKEAGVALAGGHTIDAPEPFFGLSVNGMVEVKNIKKNSGAMGGDLLFLTKPLGTGMLSAALKRGLIAEDDLQEAVESMCSLNTFGYECGKYDFVHAMNDVTGFVLLGHLMEMCRRLGCFRRN